MYTETSSLRTLKIMPRTSSKLHVHEFGFSAVCTCVLYSVHVCTVQCALVYRDGLREVVVERPFAGLSADHYTFAFDAGKRIAHEKS